MLEEQMQHMIFQYIDLRANQDERWGYIYHVPNGGQRNKVVAAKLKGQGVRAGVPDICLPVARPADDLHPAYHGLYIELKRAGNRPTESQERWQRFLASQGYLVVTIYGDPAAVVGFIEWYLGHE